MQLNIYVYIAICINVDNKMQNLKRRINTKRILEGIS